MKHLNLEKRPDRIAVLTFDCDGSPVNILTSEVFSEMEEILEALEGDTVLKGVVITSAKEGSFVVGADLTELGALGDESAVRDFIARGNALLQRLAGLGKPVVCAIHGHCLGGGLELALAADYRVASDATATLFAFPEVKLGLVPAVGGTHRLPFLIGLAEALPLMLTGRQLRVKQAQKLGLVDEVCHPYGLTQTAIGACLKLADGGRRRPKRKRPLAHRLLETVKPGRCLVLRQAEKMVMRQTRGLYPAPLAILDSVRQGYENGMEESIHQDMIRFGSLASTEAARSLSALFFAMNSRKTNPCKALPTEIKKLGILGAGLMGHGIAGVSADITETILLKDRTLEAAAKGVQAVITGLDKRCRSGAITPFERDAFSARIIPCSDYAAFNNTDLVVEAVFEDLDLKRTMLKEVEAACSEKTIFASNTSSLPISAIADGCRRPEHVIGMHYFSPVHSMPLLEVITTNRTADWVTSTAIEFGIRQGKTCIVVKDGPGFYTTRIFSIMMNEVMLLLEEGFSPYTLDDAMTRFGFPVGPVTLVDEVGIDVGHHVAGVMKAPCEARNIESASLLDYLNAEGFLGRKSGLGFYDYQKGKKKGKRRVNPALSRFVRAKEPKQVDFEELQFRVGLMMVNEAILCFQEGIIASPEDGDLGAVLGLGFPPFHGGPFRYVDSMGAAATLKCLEALQKRCGDRFKPAELLREMAVSGAMFYG